jgi:hypothetical protein
VRRLPRPRLGDRVGLLDVGAEGGNGCCAHAAIVGTGTDNAHTPGGWQAAPMSIVVLVALILVFAGIVAAAGLVILVVANNRTRN